MPSNFQQPNTREILPPAVSRRSVLSRPFHIEVRNAIIYIGLLGFLVLTIVFASQRKLEWHNGLVSAAHTRRNAAMNFHYTLDRNNKWGDSSTRTIATSSTPYISRKLSESLLNLGDATFTRHKFCDIEDPVASIKLETFLKTAKGKEISFLGDSLSAQNFDALLIHAAANGHDVEVTQNLTCRLGTAACAEMCFEGRDLKLPKRQDTCVYPLLEDTCVNATKQRLCESSYTFLQAKVNGVDLTVNYIRAYTALPKSLPSCLSALSDFKNVVEFCTIEKLVNASDLTVVNFGLHYDANPVLMAWYKLLLLDLKDLQRSRGNLFYRLTTPQHFKGRGDGIYRKVDVDKYGMRNCMKHAPPHPLNAIERDMFSSLGCGDPKEQILDFYPIFGTAGKLHKHDCTHFCWSSDLYEPVLELLTLAFERHIL